MDHGEQVAMIDEPVITHDNRENFVAQPKSSVDFGGQRGILCPW